MTKNSIPQQENLNFFQGIFIALKKVFSKEAKYQ